MLPALIVTLREGVEAALVIGLTLSYLDKTGRQHLRPAVWRGLALALVGSVALAFALEKLPVNAEAVEGTLMLAAAVLVGFTLVWMHRHARTLSSDIRQRVDAAATKEGGALALGAFIFFMVIREGAETVIFLKAVSLSTTGVMTLLGAVLGLALAIVLAVAFFQRALALDLRRFFFVTTFVLSVLVVQLLVHAYHEYSEVGWLPATAASMAIVGPIVKNSVLFIVAVLALPMIIAIAPSQARSETAPSPATPATSAGDGPEARRTRAATSRRRAWTVALLGLGGLVIGLLLWDHALARAEERLPDAQPVAMADGAVRIALEGIEPDTQRHFVTQVNGADLRFFVFVVDGKDPRVALDACEICGPKGYRQAGAQLICINCGAEIHPPSLGQSGGCNPIPVEFTVAGGDVVVTEAALASASGA